MTENTDRREPSTRHVCVLVYVYPGETRLAGATGVFIKNAQSTTIQLPVFVVTPAPPISMLTFAILGGRRSGRFSRRSLHP